MEDNQLSSEILKAAFKVHTKLGPGLLESTYQACLKFELERAGFNVKREFPVPITYDGLRLDEGYRIDLLVNDSFVIELKSQESLLPIHIAQTITYLKVGGFRTGLLINFNVISLRDGIRRLFASSKMPENEPPDQDDDYI